MNKRVIKSFAQLHGYAISQTFLKRTEDWPHDARAAYQFGRLKRTLESAYKGVPYYRQIFHEAKFDPATDFKSPEDLGKLPVLSKQDVADNYAAFIDRRFLSTSAASSTSGSTGQPLKMRLSESFMALDYACLFRHYSWAGYKFRDRMAAIRTYVPKPGQPYWKYVRGQNTLYFSAYHLSPATCEQYIEQLLSFDPVILRGYPSSIAVLAEYAYSARDRFTSLRGVFTSSESLIPGERATIERTFGPKVFNWYGMTEPALTMSECEKHNGLHLHWEYGYGEFLPVEGMPPNYYRLVTTSFNNPVMPFIRYDTGDIVQLFDAATTCGCGRNLPLIKSVHGRKDDYLVSPDGRQLPSLNFYSVFRKYPEITQFQIVQYGRNDIVAKLRFHHSIVDTAAIVRRLRPELLMRIGSAASLEIDTTGAFVTNADGKCRPVIRKLATRAVEEREEYTTSLRSLEHAWMLERRGEEVHKMDWNEPDRIPSPAVRHALAGLLSNDHYACWYPNPDCSDLLREIGKYAGVPADNVLLTHGSDLALELLSTAFTRIGDKLLLLAPNYDYFRAMVEQRGAEVVRFEYRGDGAFPLGAFLAALRTTAPRMVYISNPNNPIGYLLSHDILKQIATECSRFGAVLVLDEAYVEFCGNSFAAAALEQSHCVVCRTFSKAFGMAGLRLGYLIAPREILRVLNRLHVHKSVTEFSKVAALAALRDISTVRAYIAEVCDARQQLYEFFDRHKIQYRRSYSNFITFEYSRATELIRYLAARNIIVRDGSRYSMSGGAVRLTVTGAQSVEVLMRAIEEYLGSSGAPEIERPLAADSIDARFTGARAGTLLP